MYLGCVSYILKYDRVRSVQRNCAVVFIVFDQVLGYVNDRNVLVMGNPSG